MALRETAQVMLWELEANRLRVGLAPCQRGRRHSRIRVVEETNPDWYRAFCREYESERTRPRRRSKPDTAIKRSHTLRALNEIVTGQATTIYAERLLPYVVKETERYEQESRRTATNGHYPGPYPGRDQITIPADGWFEAALQTGNSRTSEPAFVLSERAQAIGD